MNVSRRLATMLAVLILAVIARSASATDYFLTIGGGYDPSGNQASLEANVLFFQKVLAEQHRGPRRHTIFFADGRDPAADLQVLVEQPDRKTQPATELLGSLHRRRGEEDEVTYRNHRIGDVAGPLDPDLIRNELASLARTVRRGDRLIVYVTAHGSEGPEDDSFDTTIDCWNEREITAREFEGWLDKLPSDVPVVMVMAQCYCGGFARTIFRELDDAKGLTPSLRVGFFAQRHDLPAAGCRPDIEHDEEFSSYFWGAIAGRSRNGVPIKDCDADHDGVVSFAEAYAYAVVAGETVDLPLRTSDVLLRSFSRLNATEDRSDVSDSGEPDPRDLSGTLQSFVDQGRPVSSRMVTQLARQLGFALDDDVSVVRAELGRLRRESRAQERRPRGGSGRRELLAQVAEKWPELGDERRWQRSPLLRPENQEKLLADLEALPGWQRYNERRKERDAADRDADQNELKETKVRRLLTTLESIALEQNLPRYAAPGVVERYRQLVALEESALTPPPMRP